jgi:hypothetical protein
MSYTSGMGALGSVGGTGGTGTGSGSSYQSEARSGAGSGAIHGDHSAGNRGFNVNFVGGTGNTQRTDQGINQDEGFDLKPLLWIGGGIVALFLARKFMR